MTTTSAASRLVLDAVSKSFVSGSDLRPVIDQVSLEIRDGEFLSVVGASGSGKTTLLNVAAGLVTPDSGEVRVAGKPVTGPGPERGVIFQQYAVFPWLTVRKNVEFGLRLKRSRNSRREARRIAEHYLDLVGLSDFADALPKTLSGGMRQRVAIARAYAADPDILLMDEPFGALDAQTRDRMQEVLLEILVKEQRTVLFVTHSVEEAVFLGNRVAILGGAPGRLLDVLTVPFSTPRPADLRLDHEFVALRRHIEGSLHPPSHSERRNSL